ncbi:saccharopine dehydrogenase C-terminal domain-containing protein [Bacteroidota bacterium]
MKNILILGAGQSSPYLISYLLNEAEKYDWFVTVGDKNYDLACKRIGGHPRGNAVEFDVNDEILRNTQINNADVIVNFLAPTFQYLIALDCLAHGKHVISASYENVRVADLHKDALRKGILILNEMGLDPGIDHMTAIQIINKIREKGGTITSFVSYGSGLPAPDTISNPLQYCITWNPRNVVMAGEAGAQYMEDGKLKILPHYEVFQRTWTVEVDDIGVFEAYPNRDSLVYQDLFELNKVHTMIRGTLRYPGWSETWLQIVKLGMPNESLKIPDLPNKTYSEFTEMFLPLYGGGSKLEARLARFLGINPTGKIMENLRWLGLLSSDKIDGNVKTSAEVLIQLVNKKMPLPPGGRDMVALVHEIKSTYPDRSNEIEQIISTFTEFGEPGGFTAIAKTVGLPAAIAAKLLLRNELIITGCHIPTHHTIYTRVLEELKKEGMEFKEKTQIIEA